MNTLQTKVIFLQVLLLACGATWAQSNEDCFGNVTETEASTFLTNHELLDSMDFSLDLFHKLYKKVICKFI